MRGYKGLFLCLVSWLIVIDSGLANTVPKARHLVYKVAPGGTVEIHLGGYDADGDKLSSSIISLPSSGELFDLTKLYTTHGRDPKFETSLKIKSAPHTVPERSKHRLIYKAPASSRLGPGTIASFQYMVHDGTAPSARGEVRIISDTGDGTVLVSSQFSDNTEGWIVTDNGHGAAPIHERSSHKVLNHFIYASDTLLNIDANGKDKTQWKFSAPNKFLGNQVNAYGGLLAFSIGAFSGDYGLPKRNTDIDLVILECSSCAMGKGMRFAYKMSSVNFDGNAKDFEFRLTESGGWLKDPKNTISPWTVPSKCEMVEMLHDLSAIYINGDHTVWYESVGLDDFQLKVKGVGRKVSPPLECLCTSPGTQCS